MFVETEKRPQGEAKQGTLKLSEAIRIGCKSVPDDSTFCGCAMGAGYFALTGGRNLGKDQDSGRFGGNGEWIVARLTGIPLKTIIYASRQHHNNRWTREQCADWLESEGY